MLNQLCVSRRIPVDAVLEQPVDRTCLSGSGSGRLWVGGAGSGSDDELDACAAEVLISRVTTSLEDLPAAERASVDEAVAMARRHRTVMLGMPRIQAPGPLTTLPHRGCPGEQEQRA